MLMFIAYKDRTILSIYYVNNALSLIKGLSIMYCYLYLPPVVCMRAHVLFTLFVCVFFGIVVSNTYCVVFFALFVFVLCLVYPALPVSLNCPFLFASLVFSNVLLLHVFVILHHGYSKFFVSVQIGWTYYYSSH